ncbi:hypothetical protein ACQ4PT_065406 [Festuca glaucescens]
MKHLKARILEENERRERYHIDRSVEPKGPVEIDQWLPAFMAEAKDLMAIDGPRDRDVSWLGAEQDAQLKVVAMVAGWGLGKTILAMEVYRKIEGDFQVRACAAGSRTLDLDMLLKDVLSQIDQAASSKCERWEQNHLIREIRRILAGKRYFIVIDDVWKEEHGEYVKAAFPDNHNALTRDGYTVEPYVSRALMDTVANMLADPCLRAVFEPHGRLLAAGELCCNPAVADALEAMAEEGVAVFYGGAIGERLVEDV